ncbi:MAG: YcaO-like family protein [Egibacteraceae bacterium]
MFRPFAERHPVVFGRVAARSEAFAPTCASGGAPVVIGCAAGSSAEAVIPRARGELTERVSNILAGRAAESEGRVMTTFAELRRAGAAALDPAAWPELEAATELRQARMLWVTGTSLISHDEVLVPASAVFLRHRPPPGCALMLRAGSAGVSAHLSWKTAVCHALLEVLERDLISGSWYGTDGDALALRRPALSPLLGQALDELGLQPTVLVLPGPDASTASRPNSPAPAGGPANAVCVVVCLHTAERRQQSFGARGVLVASDVSLFGGAEVAAYEALMVRWSMGTPVARRAWQDMQGSSLLTLPRGALEHALWTFHRQDSLGRWLAKAAAAKERTAMVDGWTAPETTKPDATVDERRLARLLAEHTGQDVVVVDTPAPKVCADGLTVVRVVASGARRLPSDERTVPLSHGTDRHNPLPHPFG